MENITRLTGGFLEKGRGMERLCLQISSLDSLSIDKGFVAVPLCEISARYRLVIGNTWIRMVTN
jgi:hypothetical protein